MTAETGDRLKTDERLFGWLFESRGGQASLMMARRDRLLATMTGRWVARAEAGRFDILAGRPWLFHADAVTLKDFTAPGESSVRTLPEVHVDVAGLSESLIDLVGAKSAYYSPATLTHMGVGERDESVWIVRRHTPSDELRCGMGFADVTVSFNVVPPDGGARVRRVRAPVTRPVNGFPSLCMGEEELKTALSRLDNGGGPPTWGDLVTYAREDARPPVPALLQGELDDRPAAELSSTAVRYLADVRRVWSERDLRDGVLTITDPSLKWSRRLNDVPLHVLRSIYEDIVPAFGDVRSLGAADLRSLVGFCESLGFAGEPDLPVAFRQLLADESALARMLAIGLRARWCMHPFVTDAAATRPFVSHADPTVRAYAVMTLIRLGDGTVSEGEFNELWAVAGGEAEADRWAMMSEIARTRIGRECLARRFADRKGGSDAALARRALAAVEDAARRMDRPDFLD